MNCGDHLQHAGSEGTVDHATTHYPTFPAPPGCTQHPTANHASISVLGPDIHRISTRGFANGPQSLCSATSSLLMLNANRMGCASWPRPRVDCHGRLLLQQGTHCYKLPQHYLMKANSWDL